MGDGDGDGARARQRVVLGAAVGVLALVLVLLAGAAAGPWEWPDPGTGPTWTGSSEPATGLLPTLPTPEAPPEPGDGDLGATENEVVRWLLIGVSAIIGLALLALLVRLVLMLRTTPAPPPDPRDLGTPQVDDLIDAPAIQEGIAAARQALAEERPPRDAIVRAWLSLEAAAEDAGAARRPSQTPTEFAAAVLARTEADATSVDELRTLYTRSRFSTGEVTRADAEAARADLERIAESWSAVQVPT